MAASFLDELEEERALVLADSELDVPVPPRGRFVVRCRPPLDPSKLDDIVASYRTRGALTYEQVLQLFVDVCDEILRRNPATGELESYEDGPLRFDASDDRWGDEVETARDCVAQLFHLKDGKPLAASGAAERVVDWLQTVVNDSLKSAEGKSESAAGS